MFDPMMSSNLIFGGGQVKVRSNFKVNIFTYKAHVPYSEFPEDLNMPLIFFYGA